MSWQVEIKRITDIKPIEGADSIQCAYLQDWPCVVRKGDFKVGDRVVYYPEDSIMPEATLQRMGLVGKLAGSTKNRIKAIKLRGQLSIGLIEHVHAASASAWEDGVDISDALGIIRWEQPLPESLRGIAKGHPPFFVKYDIDNLRGLKGLFNRYDYCFAECKLHGCSSSFAYNSILGFSVSSRNITLERDEGNLYWKMALKYNLEEITKEIYGLMGLTESECITVHGEIVGKGVQDLTYGLESPELFVFDIRRNNRYLDYDTRNELINKFGLRSTPKLGEGFAGEPIFSLANGMETISGQSLHIREGIVVRNYDRSKIAKVVSEAYLLRKGGTELH